MKAYDDRQEALNAIIDQASLIDAAADYLDYLAEKGLLDKDEILKVNQHLDEAVLALREMENRMRGS